MATKSRSKTQGLHYAAYKAQNRQATNRKRKLLKLQKQFPANEQITQALKAIGYRRGTPKTQHWSHTAINNAVLIKTFEGRKVKGVRVSPVKTFDPKLSIEKHMFSIKARAHMKGVTIWPNS
jgi:hypothetical protein